MCATLAFYNLFLIIGILIGIGRSTSHLSFHRELGIYKILIEIASDCIRKYMHHNIYCILAVLISSNNVGGNFVHLRS